MSFGIEYSFSLTPWAQHSEWTVGPLSSATCPICIRNILAANSQHFYWPENAIDWLDRMLITYVMWHVRTHKLQMSGPIYCSFLYCASAALAQCWGVGNNINRTFLFYHRKNWLNLTLVYKDHCKNDFTWCLNFYPSLLGQTVSLLAGWRIKKKQNVKKLMFKTFCLYNQKISLWWYAFNLFGL